MTAGADTGTARPRLFRPYRPGADRDRGFDSNRGRPPTPARSGAGIRSDPPTRPADAASMLPPVVCATALTFVLTACTGAGSYVIDLEPPLTQAAPSNQPHGFVEFYNALKGRVRTDKKHAAGFAAAEIFELRHGAHDGPCGSVDVKLIESLKARYQSEKVCSVGTVDKQHRREKVYRRRIRTQPGFHMYVVVAASEPQKVDVDVEEGKLTAVRLEASKLPAPKRFLGEDVYFGVTTSVSQPLPFAGTDSKAALMQALERDDWAVRWMAVYLLGNLRATDATAAIKQISRKDPNPEVKQMALRVYDEFKPKKRR